MKCEYCGTERQSGEYCEKCGAKLPEQKTLDQHMHKSEPFFYNGYIVYYLRNYASDTYEAQFWLGMDLVERIVITYSVLSERVPENCDPMPFFWDLFMLAHGEKDVIEYQEKNNKYPARFEIRRIENQDNEYLLSLDMQQLAEVSRR